MVMFLEDPVTGDVPHRGLVEEEDEQRATEIAPQYTAAPEVQAREGRCVGLWPTRTCWQPWLWCGACWEDGKMERQRARSLLARAFTEPLAYDGLCIP